MTDFDDPAFFGDRWAGRYDDLSQGPDPTAAVDFLAGLAPAGSSVLELAIGGGRVAIPLARRGFAVEGVEASQAVVDRLRTISGGESLPVLTGDMADVPNPGPFPLVYVVWNSLFNLTAQDRQVDTFRNVARVLEPGGVFVLECYVPDVAAYDSQFRTDAVHEDSAGFTLTVHDRIAQRIEMQHVTVDATGFRLLPTAHRYCWPAELDLMARLAGLRLRERWSDWHRAPFTSRSADHISVYELA
ncbi:methyltransferase domain-containing protein [Actinoplanes friuliensis]|uniref:methyltransferase domain-containing protein n=1 Tax=Actinoplanes friuliensis TaxID=196914 RepID=UPI0003F67C62|nr:methyltransferase domain-containing protein [Actinoplanes friuliensis]